MRRSATALAALCCASMSAAQEAPRDLLTFAQGALPVAIDTGDANLRTGMTEALYLIDGNPLKRIMTPRFGLPSDSLHITYQLPAPTRFDAFAVPNISETRSPSQTFYRQIDVFGATQMDGPYTRLASGSLTEHDDTGQQTPLTLHADMPVTFVRIALQVGLDVQKDQTFFEFSEVIGTGTQEPVALSEAFSGAWRGRGVKIELAQQGITVTGCYDGKDPLSGTVDGAVLRANGRNEAGILSQFILIGDDEEGIRGLRSTNGAPFTIYDGTPGAATACLAPEPPSLGCGDILYGLQFAYDSAELLPGSTNILAELYDGLTQLSGRKIEIAGHSSAEGSAEYNLELSQRRAQSVVSALQAMGLSTAQLSAAGYGEDRPVASNDTEAGRSLNRRVEITCLD